MFNRIFSRGGKTNRSLYHQSSATKALPPGGVPYYLRAPFIRDSEQFFLFCVPHHIRTSQRHEEAPRLTPLQLESLARRQDMHIAMPLARGDMQFIYNYHVLHGCMELS